MELVISCNFRYSILIPIALTESASVETGKMLYYDYILHEWRLHEHPVFPQPNSLVA